MAMILILLAIYAITMIAHIRFHIWIKANAGRTWTWEGCDTIEVIVCSLVWPLSIFFTLCAWLNILRRKDHSYTILGRIHAHDVRNSRPWIREMGE